MPKKKKGKKRVVSANKTVESKKDTGGSSYLNLPKDVQQLKLKKGTMRLDVIPFVVGAGNPYAEEGTVHWERTFCIHKGIGPDNGWFASLAWSAFSSNKKRTGEKCPIDEFRLKLKADPDADEQLLKDLAPKERQLFAVIDTNDRDAGIQILECSYHLFGKQLEAEIEAGDEEDGYDLFHDPEDGLTLKLNVVEKSFGGATYCEVSTVNFKKRKKSYDESIIDEAPCLDELIKYEDYDELKKILLQTTDDDSDDDDDEEETPKKKTSAKKKTAKKKTTKKEATSKKKKKDDDEDEDEDDEEESKSKKKSLRKKKTPDDDRDEDDDDDDEDWEDDEDEDEDETPKSKSKAKSKSKKKKDDDDDEDEDEDDEDDDDDSDDSDDDDDDDEDWDDDDDE